jgi:hypothetical protein
VPLGKNLQLAARAKAPARMSPGPTSWVMSTRAALGLISRITPFIAPTNQSFKPKSVVSVTMELGEIPWELRLRASVLERGSALPLWGFGRFTRKRQGTGALQDLAEYFDQPESSSSRTQLEVSKCFEKLSPISVAIALGQISAIRTSQDRGQFLQSEQIGIQRINERGDCFFKV